MKKEVAEINEDFTQCMDEMISKDGQIDALTAEKKELEAQVDRLTNDMKGVESDFKSNVTEVYLRTRIDMMQAYEDKLHHAWDLKAEISNYCRLFPEFAAAYDPPTENAGDTAPPEGGVEGKGQIENSPPQGVDLGNEEDGGGDA